MKTKHSASGVYFGSNGKATRRFLCQLSRTGHRGNIAAELFRVQKASARAKVYKGREYRDLAYGRKNDTLMRLCNLLEQDSCGMEWGWQVDSTEPFAKHVLYVELPTGQVSFHSPLRFVGPTYGGKWDESRASEHRVIQFCQRVSDAIDEQRLDVRMLAETLSEAIVRFSDHEGLAWQNSHHVRVLIGQVIPADSGPARKVAGWRKRLRVILADTLAADGWKEEFPNKWVR